MAKQEKNSIKSNCVVCGKLFVQYRPKQRFCADGCRSRHHNSERKLALEAYRIKERGA